MILGVLLLQGEEIREAAERLGSKSYAYVIRGLYERQGEYDPPSSLVSRVGEYSSVRLGDQAFLRGKDKVWRIPENSTRADFPDAWAGRVRSLLLDARAPHEMVGESAGRARKVRSKSKLARGRVEIGLELDPKGLREEVNSFLEHAIAARRLERPDRIRWATLEGVLTCTLDEKGLPIGATDVRNVELEYDRVGLDRIVRWTATLEYAWSDVGKISLPAPEEFLKKLGIRDP
jgi:hypothetical protein